MNRKLQEKRTGSALAVALRLDDPARVPRRPFRARDAMAKAHVLVDAVVARRVAHIVQNRGAVGDGFGARPGPKTVAERVHVRIGANAGIAEQIPRAADRVAAFEDRVALARAFRLQMVAGGDARESRADNKHIEMFSR